MRPDLRSTSTRRKVGRALKYRYSNQNPSLIYNHTSYGEGSMRSRGRDLQILTVDFEVEPKPPKCDSHQTRHTIDLPSFCTSFPTAFITEKIIYHGSGWLEIDRVVSGQGVMVNPTKIFASALKEGHMNEIRWELKWMEMYPFIEVINKKDRKGQFKMSMLGEFAFGY